MKFLPIFIGRCGLLIRNYYTLVPLPPPHCAGLTLGTLAIPELQSFSAALSDTPGNHTGKNGRGVIVVHVAMATKTMLKKAVEATILLS